MSTTNNTNNTDDKQVEAEQLLAEWKKLSQEMDDFFETAERETNELALQIEETIAGIETHLTNIQNANDETEAALIALEEEEAEFLRTLDLESDDEADEITESE